MYDMSKTNTGITLPDRLLHLAAEQTLTVPYNTAPPIVCTITYPDHIACDGRGRTLNPPEKAVVNHILLANGQPVLHDELLPYMHRTTRNGRLACITETLNGAEGLNTLFGGSSPREKTFITDSCRPSLVRLGRAIMFIDERSLAPSDDIARFCPQFAHLAHPGPFPAGLPRRPGKEPSERYDEHSHAMQAVGALALQCGQVGLRDMYALSLRYGPLACLRRTLLPRANRQRLAYDKMFPSPDPTVYGASSRRYIDALLELGPSTLRVSILGAAMSTLLALAEQQ